MKLEQLFNRILGMFLGIGAGDLIGGPTAMNLIFAESLIDLKRYDRQDLLKRYIDWFNKRGFDTGFITGEALKLLSKGIPVEIAVKFLDLKYPNSTGGCNPVHRSFPLAAASFIPDEKLAEYAMDQACLTHYQKIAGDVAAATVILVRHLIKGIEWEEAKKIAAKNRSEETKYALVNHGENHISSAGYAPDVLKAAIYFLDEYEDFKVALESSIQFAGYSNYSPILVGAIGGARWGADAIPRSLIQNNNVHRILEKIAKSMYIGWH